MKLTVYMYNGKTYFSKRDYYCVNEGVTWWSKLTQQHLNDVG